MSHEQPSILIVDDSTHFRGYIRDEFERAAWSVFEWDSDSQVMDFDDPFYHTLTAVVADWNLRKAFNGLEVLLAIRRGNAETACVLYSASASEGEWRVTADAARAARIHMMDPGSIPLGVLHQTVLAEVKLARFDFTEPRQAWRDYEAWINPESDDPQLANAVGAVGKEHLVPIIHQLFPERGPQRPIAYAFVTPGFSGARVFQLKDPVGTPSPGPRYVLKVAQGNSGYQALRNELVGFRRHILGAGGGQRKLVGYVSEELRPSIEGNDLASADDAWFGIAYREVGNGTGALDTFREFYLDQMPEDNRKSGYPQLVRFVERLYSDCLGYWLHHSARRRVRRLWDQSEGTTCYWLASSKQLEILTALDELRPRARMLIDRALGPNTADRMIGEIFAFIRDGRCGSRLSAPSLFHQSFETLEAETHGDLHEGNILTIKREGQNDPFVIDFTEFQPHGHPFYDYARLENDVRLRLMNSEDGSDILDEFLGHWLYQEKTLTNIADVTPLTWNLDERASRGLELVDKGYSLMTLIRSLAYQNLVVRLRDQNERPTLEGFRVQYTAALLHRTLISLASTDIVHQKRILGIWLAASLIGRLGVLAKTTK